MTQAPLVSVVVPTRNRHGLLRQTVTSIVAQRDVAVEVVVVDDASDIPVPHWTGAGVVRVVRLHRHGERSVARNAGIAAARGRWIAFCDDDDLWAPTKVSHQLERAHRTGARWIYSGEVVVDDQLDVLYGAPPPDPEAVVTGLRQFNAVPAGASNVVVEASLLAKAGPFDATLRRVEDWDMWLRLGRLATPACVREPAVAYRARFGAGGGEVELMVDEPQLLAARHGIDVDRRAMLRRAGWSAMQAGQRLVAFGWYVRAVAAGDPMSAGRALAALADPRVGTPAIYALVRRHADRAWMARAVPWLSALRGAPTTEAAGG